jgi:glycosyltransferase involved in cell wall biosynthesis
LNQKTIIYTENYIYGGLEKYLFDFLKSLDPENILLLFNEENVRIEEFAIKNHFSFEKIKLYNPFHILNNTQSNRSRISSIFTHFTLLLKTPFIFPKNYKILYRKLKLLTGYQNLFIINGGYPGALSCRSCAIAGKKNGFKHIFFNILSTPIPYYYAHQTGIIRSLYKIFLLFNEPIEKSRDKRISDSVDLFIVNSNDIAKKLIAYRNFPQEKIITIYSGIEIPDSTYKINSINNDQLKISKISNEIWIGTIAALTPLKGHKYLLDSIAKILNDKILPDDIKIRLIIVGDGVEYNNLISLAKSLKIDESVIFTGFYHNDIAEILRFVDIFIFPSLQEGLPYSISEAMAYQLPIIASNVGGIYEQIEDGINGFLVNPADSADLTKKIVLLIKSQDRWISIGETNRKKAINCFSIVNMCENLKKLIDT